MTKPYIVQDRFFKKAKEEQLRARSAFKLDEIQQKFNLVKPGQLVADLGAAPGSWSQRLGQWVKAGRVFAFDLQVMEPIATNVSIHQVDITDSDLLNKIFDQELGASPGRARPETPLLDGVVADLAPKTTGIPDADAYHSAELNEAVLDFCERYIKPGGYVITKIFQGEEFASIVARMKRLFKTVSCFKPSASRDRSRETYIIGRGLKK